ncbi:hypothetical protein CEXT_2841 [Caerostris extrusa]|uniref:Uncharacterized protein n=1 Tax=Caerostris extrusa TaxID=172846 RepID=A0AAV4R2P3_CAEEX|nr:hypothetical protein CEXT_2841 [Caerostris extrusa]
MNPASPEESGGERYICVCSQNQYFKGFVFLSLGCCELCQSGAFHPHNIIGIRNFTFPSVCVGGFPATQPHEQGETDKTNILTILGAMFLLFLRGSMDGFSSGLLAVFIPGLRNKRRVINGTVHIIEEDGIIGRGIVVSADS